MASQTSTDMPIYQTDENGNLFISMGNTAPQVRQQTPQEANLQNQLNQVRYSKEVMEKRMEIELMEMQVKVMQQEAMLRQMEAQLMLNGMEEFRAALATCTVAEGDNGGISESRPPLKQIMDEGHADMIQKNYIALARKYVQFTEHIQDERLNGPEDKNQKS